MRMDSAKTPNTRFLGNLNSVDEWVTLSNPINAQGEIDAILAICARGRPSGAKPGSNPAEPDRKLTMPTTKQAEIPIKKTATSPIITLAVAFLLRIMSNTVIPITAAVRSNSPR